MTLRYPNTPDSCSSATGKPGSFLPQNGDSLGHPLPARPSYPGPGREVEPRLFFLTRGCRPVTALLLLSAGRGRRCTPGRVLGWTTWTRYTHPAPTTRVHPPPAPHRHLHVPHRHLHVPHRLPLLVQASSVRHWSRPASRHWSRPASCYWSRLPSLLRILPSYDLLLSENPTQL